LPALEIEKKINEKAIKTVESYQKYRVMFKFDKEKIYLGNKKHDVSYFLNNWDLLK